MRISVCSIAWRQDRRSYIGPNLSEPFDSLLPRIAAMGYQGVEWWQPHIAHLDAAGLDDLRRLLDINHLAVPMVSGYFDFTGEPDLAHASVENGHRTIEAARRLGANGIRIFTGKRRSSDAGERGWCQAVRCLRELCTAAGAMYLAAEQHDWNLTDTLDGCERLCTDVGCPNLGLIFHPSHVAPDPLPAYDRLRPLIRHIHATNPGGTLATGSIDWRRLIDHLRRSGYQEWLSVEYFGAEPDRELPEEAMFLRTALAAAGDKQTEPALQTLR